MKTTDGGITAVSPDAGAALQQALRGEIVTAHNGSYDSLRSVWNGLIDKKPGALIRCTGLADVLAAVRFTGDHGWSVFVRVGRPHLTPRRPMLPHAQ